MTDNIDQVVAPADDVVAEVVPTEENLDVGQDPDAASQDVGDAEDEEAAVDEGDDTVQDAAVDNDDEEANAEGDEPTAS